MQEVRGSLTADTTDQVRHLVDGMEGDLIALRRDLHRNPELGGEEHRTARQVAERLRELGLGVHTGLGTTGVVAELTGGAPGRTLLLRADMDALPITERTALEFGSAVPGVMHACGHDAHTAALVGAASILAKMSDRLAGNVRFCFQPAEELLAGAAALIEAGVTAGVSGIAGAHVDSLMPFGTIAARAGEFLAGADFFEITVRGAGGHAARPHESVDAVYVSCHLVTALQEIVSRETKAGEVVVLSVGAIEGGRTANVAAEEVVLRGTLRWFAVSERARVLQRLEGVLAGVCGAFRARAELRITATAPVTRNDGAALDLLAAVASDSGRAELTDPGRLTVSDDVARLLEKAPGVYFLAGARTNGAPHHHPEFDMDERVVGLICELLVRYSLRYLQPAGAHSR